jgi:hypothetical protein
LFLSDDGGFSRSIHLINSFSVGLSGLILCCLCKSGHIDRIQDHRSCFREDDSAVLLSRSDFSKFAFVNRLFLVGEFPLDEYERRMIFGPLNENRDVGRVLG